MWNTNAVKLGVCVKGGLAEVLGASDDVPLDGWLWLSQFKVLVASIQRLNQSRRRAAAWALTAPAGIRPCRISDTWCTVSID